MKLKKAAVKSAEKKKKVCAEKVRNRKIGSDETGKERKKSFRRKKEQSGV